MLSVENEIRPGDCNLKSDPTLKKGFLDRTIRGLHCHIYYIKAHDFATTNRRPKLGADKTSFAPSRGR